MRLDYAVEPEPLDTAGAIAFAAGHAGIDETFIVVNGDVLTDVDIAALVAFHRSPRRQRHHPPEGRRRPDHDSASSPPTPRAGSSSFVEKPPADKVPTNLINAGTYVLEPEVLARIPGDRRVSIERETFPALAAEGAVFAMASDAYWLDTGHTRRLPASQRRSARRHPGRSARTGAPGRSRSGCGPSARPWCAARSGRRACSASEPSWPTAPRSPTASSAPAARWIAAAVVEGSVLLPGARVGAGAGCRVDPGPQLRRRRESASSPP